MTPGGPLRSQSGLNHDGTHFLTLYDVSNQYAWADTTIAFDAIWNVTSVSGTNDDGSHSITMTDIAPAYDVATWYATPFTDSISASSAMAEGHGDNGASADDTTNGIFFSSKVNDAFVFTFQSPNQDPKGFNSVFGGSKSAFAEFSADYLKVMSGLHELLQFYGVDAGSFHFDPAADAGLHNASAKYVPDHFLL